MIKQIVFLEKKESTVQLAEKVNEIIKELNKVICFIEEQKEHRRMKKIDTLSELLGVDAETLQAIGEQLKEILEEEAE